MFDHLDQMTHLGSFARAPAITFQLGGNDLHINAENAVRFKAALAGAYPDAATEVHIRVHPALINLVLDVTGASRMHALTRSFANPALHDRGCSRCLKPPTSRSDLAMWLVRLRT